VRKRTGHPSSYAEAKKMKSPIATIFLDVINYLGGPTYVDDCPFCAPFCCQWRKIAVIPVLLFNGFN